jgi:putative addiction module killer protein
VQILEYLATDGISPFACWFNDLDAPAAAKVTVALERMEQGNLGQCKSVGGGVIERVIDFGPGYRLYFGRDGDELVILLAGGTKSGQQGDIEEAQARWTEYKRRKKVGRG